MTTSVTLANNPAPPGTTSGSGLAIGGLFKLTGVEDTITAHAGGTQAAAFALSATKNFHRISVCATAADSVALPPATVGQSHFVRNDGAASAQVFGTTPDTIDGVATATGVALPAGDGAWFVCTTDGKWYTDNAATSTGSGANVFATGPTINQPHIKGVTDATPIPAAGDIGEIIESAVSGNTALTSGVTVNYQTLALTAGVWDVTGFVGFTGAAGTLVNYIQYGINTVTASLGADLSQMSTVTFASGGSAIFSLTDWTAGNAPLRRITIAAGGATIYLAGRANFSVSTCSAYGKIRATRVG